MLSKQRSYDALLDETEDSCTLICGCQLSRQYNESVALAFFILGYHFCKIRYIIPDLLDIMKIQNKLITGEIEPEEALELLKDIPYYKNDKQIKE